MTNSAPTPNLPPGFDFTDPDIYAKRLPIEELAAMRRTAPIWWNEQPMGTGGFDDGGFWVVTKHKDVKEVSRRSDAFSSLENTALPATGTAPRRNRSTRASSCC
jgi:cholest-4-en-3-one 26-monooxygenase